MAVLDFLEWLAEFGTFLVKDPFSPTTRLLKVCLTLEIGCSFSMKLLLCLTVTPTRLDWDPEPCLMEAD